MSVELKQMISLLDLTNLNEDSTENEIKALCLDAFSDAYSVAAICVYSQFIALAKTRLPTGIGLATVVNFPHAKDSEEYVLTETRQAIQNGANEIDLVLPYHHIKAGDETSALAMVKAVKAVCKQTHTCLKIIIESGAFTHVKDIETAAQIALDGGADFIKTSTGKISVGATLDAADAICRIIKKNGAEDHVGIKISGGVRTVSEARAYLNIITKHFGHAWINAKHVRIGASSLLNDIKQAMI